MKGMVSACVLVVVIFGLHQVITAGKPKMYPPLGFAIQAGDELKIVCHNEGSNVQFSTQKLTGRVNQSDFHISVDKDSGSYTFTRPHTIKEDTGWYACAEEGIAIQNDDQTIDHPETYISWIYVYVNSSAPFAVASDVIVSIPVVAGRSVVIPCRPASPHLSVRLKRLEGMGQQPDDKEYQPKVGFVIKDVTKAQNGETYACKINASHEADTILEPKYTLNVSDPDPLEKPIIEEGAEFHTAMGTKLKLGCLITVPKGEKFSLEWQGPPSVAKRRIRYNKHPISVGDDTGTRVKRKSELTIWKAGRSDRGKYICVAKGLVNNASASIEVQIWEPGNITGGQVAHAKSNESAALSCLVEGHSLSNFSWVKTNDLDWRKHSEIEESHLSVNSTYVAMKLLFTSVTPEDSGTYECRATDYAGSITSQTSLIVTEVAEDPENLTASGSAASIAGCSVFILAVIVIGIVGTWMTKRKRRETEGRNHRLLASYYS